MNKISTIRLLGLLILLVVVYASVEFFGSRGRSRSFKEKLVSIDTAAVSRMEITKNAETITIVKNDEGWKVSAKGGTQYNAKEDRIKNSLSSLQSIKPSRIATRDLEKWREFQVDSTGMRVEVYESNKKTLDIVIGRFGMQNQQRFYSYVRLYDENNVYVADNFMGFSISSDVASYRNQSLTTFNKDSVQAVRFNYPADSSFTIEKSISGKWISNSFTPDSSKTAQFISNLSRLTSSKFENNTNITGISPRYTTTVEIQGKDPIQLRAIPKNDSTCIITSSENQEGQFVDSLLFKKIFKSKSSFYSEVPE